MSSLQLSQPAVGSRLRRVPATTAGGIVMGQSERRVRVKFEPRDIWLGLFVDTAKRRLYVCLLPCLPVIIDVSSRAQSDD